MNEEQAARSSGRARRRSRWAGGAPREEQVPLDDRSMRLAELLLAGLALLAAGLLALVHSPPPHP
jgi:hypothetical protein